ncbi:MAG: hypothetical protein ACLT40_00735 [Fusobacterium sp.]
MKHKVGKLLKYKNHFLQVIESLGCKSCFFYYKNYPYQNKENTKQCYRTNYYECSIYSENYAIYFRELSEIEYLILKGDKHD